jgi:hypothetical protein
VTYDPMRPTQPETFIPVPPEPLPVADAPGPVAPAATSPVSPMATTPVSPAKRKGSGGLLNVVLAIAVCVAIGGVAFAIGRSTAPASAANLPAGLRNGFGNGGQFPTGSGAPGFGRQGGFLGGGRTINGTVESITADTITIKTATGQTVELTLGSDTTYGTKTPATAADVTTGSTVEVQLDFGARGPTNGGPAASGPIGAAGSVTVVP